jgi:hypothetical protein
MAATNGVGSRGELFCDDSTDESLEIESGRTAMRLTRLRRGQGDRAPSDLLQIGRKCDAYASGQELHLGEPDDDGQSQVALSPPRRIQQHRGQ